MSLDVARFLLIWGIRYWASEKQIFMLRCECSGGMMKIKVNKIVKLLLLFVISTIIIVLSSYWGSAVIALPPPEDTPEEILRTQIIIEARSPIDGRFLTAAEYAQLEAQLQQTPPPKLDPKIRDQIFLLRIRKTLLQFFPFLNF